MKPAILLTGTTGQLGRELRRLLPHVGEVSAFDRKQMDLSRPDEIRRAVRTVRPDLIVNAAAYTAVDKAESEQTLARAVNAEAPALLAEEARQIGAVLVHYSTDYVFDGTKATPYTEDDPANPQNAYGRSKLEGERAIQQSGADYLIFRTSWVYASEGRNFLLTILKLAAQREELRIVCDQVGAPTWSAEIALATARIVAAAARRERGFPGLHGRRGIYHMTAGGQTCWYDFAQAILEEVAEADSNAPWITAATNNLPLVVKRILPIATAEYPTPAQRPRYSVLSNTLLADTFDVALPDWRTQLHSLFSGTLPTIADP